MSFRLTVPGNLLLAGEYAVLEEGGLGLALGVEPRMTLTVSHADHWRIEGRWNGLSEVWSPGDEPTFAGKVFLKATEQLAAPPAHIVIDSSAFFSFDRKLGFGSSAALAVGLTAALARLAGVEADPQTAVEAHRHAQGSGSGYDVLASWHGGLGLFVGGAQPRWQGLDASRLPPLAVFSGAATVRTASSITLYNQWKLSHDDGAPWFLADSNSIVDELADASGSAWFAAAEKARDLGIIMGRAIGCSAELHRPDGLAHDIFIKALGAGNETGLAAAAESAGLEGLTALNISEGLRWE